MNDSNSEGFGVQSRRTFFKSVGTAAVTAATASAKSVAAELEKANAEKITGPESIPITLTVNNNVLRLQLEPRVTLLDALRNYSSLTGAKEGCDRASCGACTVLLNGKAVYSCQKLAIEAQGHEITTVEGLEQSGELSNIQKAFIEKDALMCGYCTPGFLMSLTGLFNKNPHPTADEIRHACAGNICRCGTQPHIMQAALQVAGAPIANKTEVIHG